MLLRLCVRPSPARTYRNKPHYYDYDHGCYGGREAERQRGREAERQRLVRGRVRGRV